MTDIARAGRGDGRTWWCVCAGIIVLQTLPTFGIQHTEYYMGGLTERNALSATDMKAQAEHRVTMRMVGPSVITIPEYGTTVDR